MGNILAVTSVQVQPTVSWADAKPASYYTLGMMDPDAPSRADPSNRNANHWLVGNIRGSDLNDFSNADVLEVYRGSGPPVGTGLHRYAFYLFEQTAGRIDYSNAVVVPRAFSFKDFVAQYNLGVPVAGCFYHAHNIMDEIKFKSKM